MSRPVVTWRCISFDDLTPAELYELLTLRQRVFVVEQDCVYLDNDGKDAGAWHLVGHEQDALVAYARILPAGLTYEEASIGRVITAPEARRRGLGKELMREAIARAESLFGQVPLKIGAQSYLQRFYEELGFVREGDEYDEDGIPHIHMLRSPTCGD